MKLRFLFFLLIPIFVFSQKEKKSNVDFVFHSITDNDSYHSLKLKYGISKRKILKWNPSLKKCKLHFINIKDEDPLETLKIFGQLLSKGWTKEAIPVVNKKRSLISRIFSGLFE